MIKMIFFILLTTSLWAQIDYGYLKPEEQKFYKNESFEGNNQLERIDLNVKEINKLHAEIAALKAELVRMKQEIEELKKKK